VTDSLSAPGTGWTIEGAISTVQPGVSGALTRGWEVTFKTASGVVGTVFVPGLSLSVDQARIAVQAQATALDQVMALKG
jgi:hypothetical protein